MPKYIPKHILRDSNKIRKSDVYEEIAKLTVLQAVRDWVDLHKEKKKKPLWLGKGCNESSEIKNIENFFLSERFNMFTNIDGKVLLDYLKETYLFCGTYKKTKETDKKRFLMNRGF